MVTSEDILGAVDEGQENLRRLLAMQNAVRAPAGSMQEQVESNVNQIPFPPATREQQMQESINKIKRMEQNRQMNESMPPGITMQQGPMLAEEMTPVQKLMNLPEREVAAVKAGPVLKKAEQEIMTVTPPPTLKNTEESIKELGDLSKQAIQKSAGEESKLGKEALQINSQIDALLNRPVTSNSDELFRADLVDSIRQAQLATLRQEKRFNELVDKAGRPLFEKEDTAKAAILALAPIVAGYLVDGARGGAVGAQAGQIGLAKFEDAKQKQLDRELKTIMSGSKILQSGITSQVGLAQVLSKLPASDREKERIYIQSATKLIGDKLSYNNSEKQRNFDLLKQGLITQQKFADNNLALNKERADLELEYNKLQLSIAELSEKKAGRIQEKGLSDLGFGFRMKPGTNSKDRDKAQKIVGSYGNVQAAMNDVIEAIRNSNLSSITSWTDAGEDLQRKSIILKDALIEFSKRGGNLARNEERIVDNLGFNLTGEGSIRNIWKVAMNPNQVANQLETVLGGLKRRTAGLVTPLGVELIEEPKQQAARAAARPVAQPKQSSLDVPVKLSTDPKKAEEEFKKLPSGQVFIRPDGQVKRKK